jgi:hypothetical protein
VSEPADAGAPSTVVFDDRECDLRAESSQRTALASAAVVAEVRQLQYIVGKSEALTSVCI